MDKLNKLFEWWKREWSYLIGLLIFLFLFVGLILISIRIVGQYKENETKQITNLLQILLSWPIFGTLAFIIFTCNFHSSIDSFLSNNKPKTPWTDERQKESETKTVVNIEGENKELPIGNPEQVAKVKQLKKLLNKNKKEKAQTEEQLKARQAVSEIYEFSYLALFFVDITKRVLRWFFDCKGKDTITYESFNITWQQSILDSGQRATIFNVLQQNGMISGVIGGAFSITEKGEKFLKFIGFVS